MARIVSDDLDGIAAGGWQSAAKIVGRMGPVDRRMQDADIGGRSARVEECGNHGSSQNRRLRHPLSECQHDSVARNHRLPERREIEGRSQRRRGGRRRIDQSFAARVRQSANCAAGSRSSSKIESAPYRIFVNMAEQGANVELEINGQTPAHLMPATANRSSDRWPGRSAKETCHCLAAATTGRTSRETPRQPTSSAPRNRRARGLPTAEQADSRGIGNHRGRQAAARPTLSTTPPGPIAHKSSFTHRPSFSIIEVCRLAIVANFPGQQFRNPVYGGRPRLSFGAKALCPRLDVRRSARRIGAVGRLPTLETERHARGRLIRPSGWVSRCGWDRPSGRGGPRDIVRHGGPARRRDRRAPQAQGDSRPDGPRLSQRNFLRRRRRIADHDRPRAAVGRRSKADECFGFVRPARTKSAFNARCDAGGRRKEAAGLGRLGGRSSARTRRSRQTDDRQSVFGRRLFRQSGARPGRVSDSTCVAARRQRRFRALRPRGAWSGRCRRTLSMGTRATA